MPHRETKDEKCRHIASMVPTSRAAVSLLSLTHWALLRSEFSGMVAQCFVVAAWERVFSSSARTPAGPDGLRGCPPSHAVSALLHFFHSNSPIRPRGFEASPLHCLSVTLSLSVPLSSGLLSPIGALCLSVPGFLGMCFGVDVF